MSRLVLCVLAMYFGVSCALLTVRHTDRPEDLVTPVNVSSQCLADTSHWMSQLRRGVPWALQMLDSATKLPSGLLMGNQAHMGNFDQCLAVAVKDDVTSFQGRYCRPFMKIIIQGQVMQTPPMLYAVCVPSSCSPEEIPNLLSQYIGPALSMNMIVLASNEFNCYIKESSVRLDTGALTFLILSCILIAIVVISAVIEWRLGDKTHPLVRACSLTSTCRSLFSIRRHPADISCLHGLRVGSMLWVILGHRYSQEQFMPITNRNSLIEYMYDPMKMTVSNAMLSVDTFFFLSGFLICHSFFRELKRSPAVDIIKFYIYRYLRLTIPMSIVILFYITCMTLIGDGPLWNSYMYYESRNCRVNWWTNLVYVNTYIMAQGTWGCLGQTWYTAVDMQLAWLSPLILIPLYHSPRAGLQLMSLLILISCFIPFTVTYIFRFPMSSIQVNYDVPMEGVPEGDFTSQIYTATQCRATPYLCGIIFCYFLIKIKGKSLQLTNTKMFLGWICCTAVALTTIYTLAIPYQPDYVYDLVGSAFYAGFHRIAWSAVLIWIIFACINNYGGIIDIILSWKYLLPISRLTYASYLVHLVILQYKTGMSRTQSYFNDFNAVHNFFGDLLPVFFSAFLLYVTVEGPSLALQRIAFSKGTNSETKKNDAIVKDDK